MKAETPYFAFLAFPVDTLRPTASRMSFLNASASTSSPSWMSIARLALPSRLELKILAGSFSEAPLRNSRQDDRPVLQDKLGG